MEVQQEETRWLIRMTSEATVTCAGPLKEALIEGLGSGRDLCLDLAQVEEVDISIVQLLWLAGHEAKRSGVSLEVHTSEVVAAAIAEAGLGAIAGPCVGSDNGESSSHG